MLGGLEEHVTRVRRARVGCHTALAQACAPRACLRGRGAWAWVAQAWRAPPECRRATASHKTASRPTPRAPRAAGRRVGQRRRPRAVRPRRCPRARAAPAGARQLWQHRRGRGRGRRGRRRHGGRAGGAEARVCGGARGMGEAVGGGAARVGGRAGGSGEVGRGPRPRGGMCVGRLNELHTFWRVVPGGEGVRRGSALAPSWQGAAAPCRRSLRRAPPPLSRPIASTRRSCASSGTARATRCGAGGQADSNLRPGGAALRRAPDTMRHRYAAAVDFTIPAPSPSPHHRFARLCLSLNAGQGAAGQAQGPQGARLGPVFRGRRPPHRAARKRPRRALARRRGAARAACGGARRGRGCRRRRRRERKRRRAAGRAGGGGAGRAGGVAVQGCGHRSGAGQYATAAGGLPGGAVRRTEADERAAGKLWGRRPQTSVCIIYDTVTLAKPRCSLLDCGWLCGGWLCRRMALQTWLCLGVDAFAAAARGSVRRHAAACRRHAACTPRRSRASLACALHAARPRLARDTQQAAARV